MRDEPANLPNLRRRSRISWPRLHRSTWVATVVLAILLGLMIVPGEYLGRSTSSSFSPSKPGVVFDFEHGWPWVFLRRQMELPPGVPTSVEPNRNVPPWLQRWAWSFAGEVVGGPTDSWAAELGWWPGLLALDVVVAGALVCALAFAMEWRRRRRRLYQFSLAELFVLVLLVGGGLGWWKANERAYAAERRSESDLRLTYVRAAEEYCGPSWLRRVAGRNNLHVFDRVVSLAFNDANDYRHMATYAAAFPNVERLYLSRYSNERSGVPITDFDLHLDQLSEFRRLRFLHLELPEDVDLIGKSLPTLPHLRELKVMSGPGHLFPRANPELLRILSDVRGLKRLTIQGAGGIDLRGWRFIGSMDSLEVLEIYGAGLDDEGLEALAMSKTLTALSVQNNFQGVGNLAYLRATPTLRQLSLSNYNLNDASLDSLGQIKTLKRLSIRGDLTQAGINRLHETLPDCTIDWTDTVHLDGK
jgi:hypothetical protein